MNRLLILTAALAGLHLGVQAGELPAANPIVVGNTRVTVITPSLFRMEYAMQGRFVDDQTLFACDRSALCRDFTFSKVGPNRYQIETDYFRMQFEDDGYPAVGRYNMGLYLKKADGTETEIKGRANSGKNLGGAISTLDMVKDRVSTQNGLLSREGWYVIDDTGKDLVIDGGLKLRDRTHVTDRYYFMYGTDYKAAFASLGAVSGHVPMTRKYMHGMWYCRWWDYTADEYLQLIDDYDEHDFPIDNIVFDMGWHLQKEATVGTGASLSRGWTGYTWNPRYIPDPEALMRKMHERRLSVSINDHPHDGIRPHEAGYADFLAEMRREKPESIINDSVVMFDLGDKTYMKYFFKYTHEPSERMGVDFWWLDWQQSSTYPRVLGTTTSSLAWINKLYYDRSKRDGLRGASYSRWAGWGDHRYPIQFSGDSFANWNLLAFEVELTATSSNAGCYYWAHDIGGFYGGSGPEYPELYARWSQFGALSASLKIHCTRDPKLDRRPWMQGEAATRSLRASYHLRSRLFPYIYTSVRQTHETMVPLIRQMYIDYPEADEAYENPQQYLFGDLLLVAPITTPGKGDNKIAAQTVWFPEGDTWYDWFSGKAYPGGQKPGVAKGLDEFPLFARGGWIIPMQPYTPRPATEPLDELVLRCYPGADGADNTYTLYEDDGISDACDRGGYAKTALNYRREGSRVTIGIAAAKGSYEGQPQRRSYRIELPAVRSVGAVRVGTKRISPVRDETIRGYVLEIPARSIRTAVTVTVEQLQADGSGV